MQITNYLADLPQTGQIVDMSDSPPIGAGCLVVANNLYLCNKLQEIHLSSCEIKDSGAKLLFKALVPHKELQIVNLDQNDIGDGCLDEVYQLLCANSSIKCVSLAGCQTTASGRQRILREQISRVQV